MHMHAKGIDDSDDWAGDESTFAGDEREQSAREQMAFALAQLVQSAAVPVGAVLVLIRGPFVPTGVIVGGAATPGPLDPVVLNEILAVAHDDQAVATMARVLLGHGDQIELAIARDRAGAIQGVIVARVGNRVPQSWLRHVLGRAADSLAGWQSAWAPWPSQALLDAIPEPCVAHEHGLVLATNAAAARCFNRTPFELTGMPIAAFTRQLKPIRTCKLMIGGAPRTAIIFEGDARQRLECRLIDVVDRVIARRHTVVRQIARISIDRRDTAVVGVPASAADELVSIALLDMTAYFVTPSAQNHIRIGVISDGESVSLEMVATGSICRLPDIDHIGAVYCASRTRSLGGELFVEATLSERILRITLRGSR